MARVLRMPEVADDPTAAVLAAWLVHESDAFSSAQSLATVETEQLLVSVEVTEPGVLLKALVRPGTHVDAGTPLAVLGEPGETVGDLTALLAELGLAEPAGVAVTERSGPDDRPRHAAGLIGIEPDPRSTSWFEPTAPAPAPPEALEAPEVPEVPEETPAPAPAEENADREPAPASGPEHEPELVPEPVVVPQVRLRATVDAGPLRAVLAEVPDVSLAALVIKAVTVAMRRVPGLSASSGSQDVAVPRWSGDTPVTPVIRVAGLMTATMLTSTLDDLDARAREGRIAAHELEGASITVVDLGPYGAQEPDLDATSRRPVVLAVGAIREEALVVDGVLAAGHALTVSLGVDETLADPARSARWLAELVGLLEHPVRFLT